MTDFGWHYPPGVTGNELEIAGPDYEIESDIPCPKCGEEQMECGYKHQRWLACGSCNEVTEIDQSLDGPDPDDQWDRKVERQIEGHE